MQQSRSYAPSLSPISFPCANGASSKALLARASCAPAIGGLALIICSTWSVAAAAGPCLGGAFSQAVSWRWLFCERASSSAFAQRPHSNTDINLPLCGVALILVFIFLDLRMPTDSVRSRLLRMDWAYVTHICRRLIWLTYDFAEAISS